MSLNVILIIYQLGFFFLPISPFLLSLPVVLFLSWVILVFIWHKNQLQIHAIIYINHTPKTNPVVSFIGTSFKNIAKYPIVTPTGKAHNSIPYVILYHQCLLTKASNLDDFEHRGDITPDRIHVPIGRNNIPNNTPKVHAVSIGIGVFFNGYIGYSMEYNHIVHTTPFKIVIAFILLFFFLFL